MFCTTFCKRFNVTNLKNICKLNLFLHQGAYNKAKTYYLFNHVDLTITYHSGAKEEWGSAFKENGGRIICKTTNIFVFVMQNSECMFLLNLFFPQLLKWFHEASNMVISMTVSTRYRQKYHTIHFLLVNNQMSLIHTL